MATSSARKIKYTHIPKDGRTPIYDTSQKKWIYSDNPTSTQINASSAELIATGTAAAEAKSAATDAQSAAATAQSTANSKTTLSDALNGVRTDVFRVEYLNPASALKRRQFYISMTEHTDGWDFAICVEEKSADGSTTGYCLPIRQIADLLARVGTIEQTLGISS